jgi:hypothetical protein
MTELDEELIPLVKEIIDEFGKEVEYAHEVTGEYDPETGTAPVDPLTKRFKVAPPEDLKGQYFNGDSLVLAGDKKLTSAAADYDDPPKPGDEFTFDSVTWEVIAKREVFSGDEVCLYEFQVRVS